MAFSLQIPVLPDKAPLSFYGIVLVLVLSTTYFVYATYTANKPIKGFPIVALTEEGLSAKQSWFKKGREIVDKGLATIDGPFQVITATGPKICLPNKFAEEIKDHPDLSFMKSVSDEFFGEYPGFSPFGTNSRNHHERFLAEVLRTKLTQSLGLVTNDLVDETMQAIHDLFGEDAEWHEEALKPKVLKLVSRLSSRVFLGTRLCRNERWLEIAKTIRSTHLLVRFCFAWRVRKEYADAQRLITPEIEFCKERTRKAHAAGQKASKTADMIGWMYEVARERSLDISYVDNQLGLTLAAIHTTSEALATLLLHVIQHPEIMEPLRREIIQVVGEHGWSKQALYKLRLMDSLLRESQRCHGINYVSMQRIATRAITLSSGSTIPAGTRLLVAKRTQDPAIYANPSTFDAYRFLREREELEKAGQPMTSQHVSVTPQHMGWGYGEHSCPGRFFASNELKIALAHLLLKYDWQGVEGGGEMFMHFETNENVSPKCKVQLRRRKEEISLDLEEGVVGLDR